MCRTGWRGHTPHEWNRQWIRRNHLGAPSVVVRTVCGMDEIRFCTSFLHIKPHACVSSATTALGPGVLRRKRRNRTNSHISRRCRIRFFFGGSPATDGADSASFLGTRLLSSGRQRSKRSGMETHESWRGVLPDALFCTRAAHVPSGAYAAEAQPRMQMRPRREGRECPCGECFPRRMRHQVGAMDDAPTLSLPEAAAACAVSAETIRRRIKSGAIDGAIRDKTGAWRLPVAGLVAAGLRPNLSGHSGNIALSSAEVARLEALAHERAETIAMLRAELAALRQLVRDLAMRGQPT